MTQDEIIEMARQSQQESFCSDKGHWFKMEAKDLERFAKLVAAKEREECAQICENFADVDSYPDGIIQDYHAHLIRLRGKV